MYEITIKNGSSTEVLHDSEPDSYRKILSGSFTEIATSVCRPTAQFSISPQNPAYDLINEMNTIIIIRNLQTDEVEFEGRIIQKLRDAFGSDGRIIREYSAEGLISWLMDSRQLYRKATETPASFLGYVLSQHNQRYPEKTIELGFCDVLTPLETETNYRSTLEEISTNLLKRLGGEIVVRRNGNGTLCLDYLQDGIGSQMTTVVRLGRNLRSISQRVDPTKVINRLIPLGKKQDDGSRLTLLGYFTAEPSRFWIEDDDSRSNYTPIEGTATFDDAETQEELAIRGTAALEKGVAPKFGYSAEVLDLSTIGEEVNDLRAGNTYRFVCETNDIDDDLRLTKRTVNILKPYMPVVEIGSKPEHMSDTALKTKKEVDNINERLDQIDSLINDSDWVTREEFEGYQDELSQYFDSLDVWRTNVDTAIQNIETWRSGELNTWRLNVDTAIAALQAQVAALRSQVNANTTALNGHKFWDGTQEEYDDLGTYDSKTWYGVYE